MNEIKDCEEKLRIAMLESNVPALDALIADDLVFVTHTGQIISKNDDLGAHRQKAFTLSRIHFARQEIREFGNLGIYFTNTPPMGSFGAWLTILEK